MPNQWRYNAILPLSPKRNSDPLLSGATRATDRAYPEPACMWLQCYIPSSDPVAVEAGPLPSPYSEHFYEHERQQKMFGCSANEHEHHPLEDRSSPPCSLKSKPKLIIRGAYASCRQQSVNTTIERYLASPWFLEVETFKLYRAGCAPAVGSGP